MRGGKGIRRLVFCLGVLLLASGQLFAQAEQAPPDQGNVKIFLALSMGFGLAIAVFGGAIGQSRAIAAAVEAIARQPEAGGRIMGAMIIGLALIETLVIYMFLICFLLYGQF